MWEISGAAVGLGAAAGLGVGLHPLPGNNARL